MRITITFDFEKNELSAILTDAIRDNLFTQDPGKLPKPETKPITKPPAGQKKIARTKICVKCGRSFEPRSNVQKFCSEACGLKPRWIPKKKRKIEDPGQKSNGPDNLEMNKNVEDPLRVTGHKYRSHEADWKN